MWRFLVVDDNENDAVMLSYCVEEEFSEVASVQIAATLKGALEWLDPRRHKPFDAVLLDLSLPDSREPIETFRAVAGAVRDRMPVVIYSGRDSERGLVDMLIAEGADSYLIKGQASARQVFETLRDAVQRRRYTARLNAREAQLVDDSKLRSQKFIESTHDASSDPKLGMLAEVLESHGDILRDVLHIQAHLRESHAKMSERLDHTQDAADTARTKALSAHEAAELVGEKTNKLAELTAEQQRRLSALGTAIAFIGYLAGDNKEAILTFLQGLF